MRVRALSSADIRASLPMTEAIASAQRAFTELSTATAHMPLRTPVETSHGVTLFMPAYLESHRALAQKIVSIYPANPSQGLPVISGLVVVLDPQTGQPQALLDGGTLTSIRTGAASGAATDLLARKESRRLVVFGAGRQAYDQIMAVRTVRPIEDIRILSKAGSTCTALAQRLREEGLQAESTRDPAGALAKADVVVCATPSTRPLFRDGDVPAGVHINAIGSFTPTMQEVPAETVARSHIVVDQFEASLAEAGDLLKPLAAGLIDRQHFETTLGDVLAGRSRGRDSQDQITLFKSVGLAIQDAAAAQAAVRRATEQDLGTMIDF